MNMHVPQTLEARAELETLLSVNRLMLTPQNNKPVMGIVQDTLLGTYKLTSPQEFLERDVFMNLVYTTLGDDWDGTLPIPCILSPRPLWSGRQLVSMMLPPSLCWTSPPWTRGESTIVRDGEIVTGRFDKSVLGRTERGLIHLLIYNYGFETATTVVRRLQLCTGKWLSDRGFSVGIADCCTTAIEGVERTVREATTSTVPKNEHHATQLLNRACESAGKLVRSACPQSNAFKQMADAGSKGSSLNICQISACVGQQNVNGQHIVPAIGCTRTLPHFFQNDKRSKARGFVSASYLKGLSPSEFFFHAMGGREGLIVS